MFKTVSNLLVKFFVVILVLSFAVWGVGDVFRGGRSDALAKVAGQSVTLSEVKDLASNQLRQLSSMMGGQVPPAVVQQVEKKVLYSLINQRLLEHTSAKLGVQVGDDLVAEHIAAEPAFRNESGKFDKAVFNSYLDRLGMSEKKLVSDIRNQMAVEFVADTLAAVPVVAPNIEKLLYAYEAERRSLSMLVIPESAVRDVPEPDNASLLQYYDKEKERFAAPELRDISYVTVSAASVKDKATVSDEELQTEFNNRKDSFVKPELRKLRQMGFADEGEAKKAEAMFAEGKKFDEVAAALLGKNSKGVDLGETAEADLTRGGVVPASGAKEVFSLPKGGVTKPIKTSMGWLIFSVDGITQPHSENFDEVKQALKAELERDRQADALYAVATKLEDAVAGGARLEEAAQQLGLELRTLTALRKDAAADGKKEVTKDRPEDFESLLEMAYRTEQGMDSELFSPERGSVYYMLRVDNVQATRIRTLDEVRGTVISEWKQWKRADMLRQIAEREQASVTNVAEAERAAAFSRSASGLALSLKNIGPIYRNASEADAGLPDAMVAEVFSLPEGGFTHAYKRADGAYVLARVTDVAEAPAGGDMQQRIREQAESSFGTDAVMQYLGYAHRRFPVKLIEKNFPKAPADAGVQGDVAVQ